MTADGTVLRPLDPDEARAVAARLAADGVESVAVCLLHSYRFPAHEEQLGAILREELPGVVVSLSSEILREQREYERSATTVVNAYVRPLMERYVAGIRSGLDGAGIEAPLTIMQSSGGVMTAEDAGRRPVLALESGPAAGVVAALGVAQRLGYRERDLVRHGRHDREGVADRERRRLARPRVRGRRLAVGRQPADARRGRAAADPDDRHRRGRRGRRLDRVARRRGRAAGRAAQRGRRAGAGLLRPRRRRTRP